MNKLKTLLVAVLILFQHQAKALPYQKSTCAQGDNRIASDYPAVMRLRSSLSEQELSCTAFLISRSCALTAGHCEKHAVFAEFNVPDGDGSDFLAVSSAAQDVYQVDQKSIDARFHKTGADFAVIRLKKNKITGLYPGDVQGVMETQIQTPEKGEEIRIVGFGSSYVSRDKFLSQKTDVGVVRETNYRRGFPFIPTLSSVSYTTSTSGGDSGAPIILEKTGKVIGIHNAGSCYHRSQRNSGTLFDRQEDLLKAIGRCLKEENRNR